MTRKPIPTTRKPIGYLTVTRIVRESSPIETARDGASTIGQYIDEYLSRAAAHGHSIQTVELNFDLEQWEQLATEVYAGYVDPDFAD
jgi:hypothetical protein